MRNSLFSWLHRRSGIDSEFLDSIHAIDWFSNCGSTTDIDLPLPCQQVNSWQEAMQVCDSQSSSDAMLSARNDLTAYLSQNYAKQFQRWNELTDKAKEECVELLVQRVWTPFSMSHSLGKSFVTATSWNVLAAIMEREYRDCKGTPAFFLHVLEIYRCGHFPCGWIGTWPSGKLLYY
jgi:hypothetical protein